MDRPSDSDTTLTPEKDSQPSCLQKDRVTSPAKDSESTPSDSREKDSSSTTNEAQAQAQAQAQAPHTPDGKRIMTQDDCYDKLGYSWSSSKKWMLLSSIFAVQLSMNFNTSVYPNTVRPLSDYFDVSEQKARVSQCVFLVLYAFGCELWAPWSEEFGRWPILQASLFLVNVWQILGALAPNFATVVVARALGGLSSAGGSVTLGMVADLYEQENQDWAVAFVVLSSVMGTSIGPVVGGPMQKYLSWRWNFWIQLIFGVAVQAVHFFMPESRATVLMDREAKRRRREQGEDIWGPNEVKKPRVSMHEVRVTWIRPFEMFVREPIVLSCSLLSGFSDALIFTFQEGFHSVYAKWNFGLMQMAWTFIPINIGYLVAYASYAPWIVGDQRITRIRGPDALQPEHRLKWLLYLAPLETIGLFGFAWTSRASHWIGPVIFSGVIAVANYAIYMSTVSYMLAAYGPYSASATGGNGFARDLLAGIATMYSTPLYSNIDPDSGRTNQYASTILACLALLVTAPVYLIYWYGPWLRQRSKFAESLREARHGRRPSQPPEELQEPGIV